MLHQQSPTTSHHHQSSSLLPHVIFLSHNCKTGYFKISIFSIIILHIQQLYLVFEDHKKRATYISLSYLIWLLRIKLMLTNRIMMNDVCTLIAKSIYQIMNILRLRNCCVNAIQVPTDHLQCSNLLHHQLKLITLKYFEFFLLTTNMHPWNKP